MAIISNSHMPGSVSSHVRLSLLNTMEMRQLDSVRLDVQLVTMHLMILIYVWMTVRLPHQFQVRIYLEIQLIKSV